MIVAGYTFSHLSWWLLGVLILIVVFVAVFTFAPEIVAQIAEQVTGIGKLFGRLLAEISKVFFQLGSTLWRIWGLLFALRWRAQFSIRYLFASTTLGILLLGAFYLCVELLFSIVNGFRSALPDLYARMDIAFSSKLPSLHEWLKKINMPHIPEIPFKVEIVLLFLAVLTFRHHLREFSASRRRESIPPALEELFLEFDKFRKTTPTPSKESFLETLLKKIKEVLDKKNARDIHFSVIEEEEVVDSRGVPKKTGILQITFLPAGSPLDKSLRFPRGLGGAGKAYDQKVAIYIPSVRHQIGIDLDNEQSVGVTYIKGAGTRKLGSILSVPILANAKQDAVAVIAVSSNRRNGFYPEDFEIVRLAAAIISTLY